MNMIVFSLSIDGIQFDIIGLRFLFSGALFLVYRTFQYFLCDSIFVSVSRIFYDSNSNNNKKNT